MNPLRLLPPEMAHKAGLCALKHGLGPRSAPDDKALETSLFGKVFSNPIGLAAGAEKKGEALVGWARMGFGFVEVGTVTVKPRSGNPGARLWRLSKEKSVVNWMGLPGAGIDVFSANLKKFHATSESKRMALGASVASPDGCLDEFKQLSVACAPLVDYLTLNSSCPNVIHAQEDDCSPAQLAAKQIKAVVSEAGGKPVLLKLGPTRDEVVLKMMVETAMEAGAAGIVAMNTVPYASRELLDDVSLDWPMRDGQAVGGFSGPALLDMSCWMVEQIRAIIGPDAPLMGVGGVQSGANAVRMLEAGANVLQLYTGLIYKGPTLLKEMKQSIIVARSQQAAA